MSADEMALAIHGASATAGTALRRLEEGCGGKPSPPWRPCASLRADEVAAVTPQGEAYVRAVYEAGLASGTREGRMLAKLASQALLADGHTVPDAPPPTRRSMSPDAVRMREKRARQRASNGERVPNAFEQNERVREQTNAFALSLKSMENKSSEEERESAGARECSNEHVREQANVREHVRMTGPGLLTTIDPNLTLHDESRAAAQQIGIVEIDVQWRRFVDRCVARGERSCDFQALFRSRLAFFRNDERRERERDQRDRESGVRKVDRSLFIQQDPPGTVRRWKVGE